jgi:gluconolactonase
MLQLRSPVGLDRLETFAEGLDHAEGIAILPEGTIYVGGEAGQIYRIADDDGIEQVASTGGFALGLAADADGLLYVCDNVRKAVLRVDPKSGEVTVFTTGLADRPIAVPNWGAFDSLGNYYVSDSGDWQGGNGLIWVVRPGGRAEVWTEESANFPNGLAVAPDGSRLFVVESTPDAAIIEIPIESDGGAGRRRVLCGLGLAVPDGVAVAADGSLIVACYRPDVICRWHPDDGLTILAGDPQGTVLAAPTNVAFDGPGLGRLIVPNLGRWHLTRGELGVNGTPLFYPTADQLEG